MGVHSPPVGLNYCVQLVNAKIDFYPGNAINLPPQLNPPLGAQKFALFARVCGGLDCPIKDFIDRIDPWPPSQQANKPSDRDVNTPPTAKVPPYVPPTRKLHVSVWTHT